MIRLNIATTQKAMLVHRINTPLRLFSTTAGVQFANTQSVFAPKKSAASKKLEELKAKLKKERETYKKLQAKVTSVNQKLTKKTKQAKAKEIANKEKAKAKVKKDKALTEAFKSFHKVSAFNWYLKENHSDLSEAHKSWASLPDYEKDLYQDKAEEYNESQLAIYTPKPKGPVYGFAAYLKENYVPGTEASQAFKDLSVEWKSLSEDEKAQYKRNENEYSAYKEELQQWKQNRLDLYNKKNGTDFVL